MSKTRRGVKALLILTMTTEQELKKEIEELVNPFLKEWTGNSYPHLVDDDENDGESLRESIFELVQSERQRILQIFIKWKENKCEVCADSVKFPDGDVCPAFYIFNEDDWKDLKTQIQECKARKEKGK